MRDGDWNPLPSRIPIPILAPCTTWASGGDRFWCYYCHGFRTKAYYYYCHGSCDQLQEEDDKLLLCSRSQCGWSFRNSSPRENSCTAVAAKAVPSFPSPPFRIFFLSLISLSSSEIDSAWWTRSILFFPNSIPLGRRELWLTEVKNDSECESLCSCRWRHGRRCYGPIDAPRRMVSLRPFPRSVSREPSPKRQSP